MIRIFYNQFLASLGAIWIIAKNSQNYENSQNSPTRQIAYAGRKFSERKSIHITKKKARKKGYQWQKIRQKILSYLKNTLWKSKRIVQLHTLYIFGIDRLRAFNLLKNTHWQLALVTNHSESNSLEEIFKFSRKNMRRCVNDGLRNKREDECVLF